jgi:5-formyltetrahydrofolate cyclo-ligase
MAEDWIPSAMDPTDAVAAAKRETRARASSARKGLDSAARRIASENAALRLIGLSELGQARYVLSYFALPAEIDPLPAMRELRNRGVAIAYPRVERPGVLGTYLVDDEGALLPGKFGLSQPAENSPALAPSLIDAAIVPGVAFDRRGMRLGYGGGYYDRLLPRLRPDCLRIGLAFDEQLLAEIPAEPHDARIDIIVTQTQVLRPQAR